MAVKKRIRHNQKEQDMAAILEYIQEIVHAPHYRSPSKVLIQNCENIVMYLSRLNGTEQDFWKYLQAIEDFFLHLMANESTEMRNEIVTAVMDKLYSYISDPQSDVGPPTSIVLIVVDDSDPELRLSAARWIVQQRQNGPGGAGLRNALSCLYRWLFEWHGTPALASWTFCFIKILEENDYFDMLIDVTVDNIENLLSKLTQVQHRQAVYDLVLHVLSSLRESVDAFDRISPLVADILVTLAAGSMQESRQILQNLVNILTAMMNFNMNSLKGTALFYFRKKHAHVIKCLERHMASETCTLLQIPPWKHRKVDQPSTPDKTRVGRVGLLNLGNTCYMNSVMQALLIARQFSNHVILNMNKAPYWSRMGVLFAKMTYSFNTKLNPDEFFSIAKPSSFTWNAQHDSSEFLGYLLELLQSYEHLSDANFDYGRPVAFSANRLRFVRPHTQTSSHISEDHQESIRSRRSMSPRPGSSNAAGSCSSTITSSQKRSSSEVPSAPKRRFRNSDPIHRRESVIDSMFAGVLQTRIECVHCHSSSISRDVYRDLQLAFPEKPDGWQYSVQSLLEYYCSTESLTGDNQYKCHACNNLRDAEKSVIIETTPKYLVLVLKNFKFDAKLKVQTKLMHSVLYNTNISLPRSQQEPNSYVLFAAIIHTGTTLDSGHYYTLAKDHDQWYSYNDAVVSLTDELELSKLKRTSTPYILFYRRTDVEEGSAPALENLPPAIQEKVLAHNKEFVQSYQHKLLTRP